MVFPSLISSASGIRLCFNQNGWQDASSRVVASLGVGGSAVPCPSPLAPHSRAQASLADPHGEQNHLASLGPNTSLPF